MRAKVKKTSRTAKSGNRIRASASALSTKETDFSAFLYNELKECKSEESLQTLLHASPAAIIVANFEGRIEYINQKSEEWFGYRLKDIPTVEKWYQLAYPDPAYRAKIVPPWEAAVAQAHRTPKNIKPTEVLVHCKNGSTRYVVGQTAVIANRIMVIFNDLTEQKRTEAALRELTQQLLQSQDEERRRIARELHDSTTQDLVGTLLLLSTIKKRLPDAESGTVRMLDECTETLRRNISELRTLTFLLHPPSLEHVGLIGAIRDLADEFGRRSGIQISLELSDPIARLPADYELTLYRILQESLLNIHRHSGSPTAIIRLTFEHDKIQLKIQDAGQGLPARALKREGGVGISGMRERLHHLGGMLDLQTGKRGTTVVATLPMPDLNQD